MWKRLHIPHLAVPVFHSTVVNGESSSTMDVPLLMAKPRDSPVVCLETCKARCERSSLFSPRDMLKYFSSCIDDKTSIVSGTYRVSAILEQQYIIDDGFRHPTTQAVSQKVSASRSIIQIDAISISET